MSNWFSELKTVFFVVLGICLGALLTAPDGRSTADDLPILYETERIYSELYARTAPGVVSIIVTQGSGADRAGEGVGSGFVLDTAGHIVTNFHVVDGASRIVVNMYDGTIVRAELIGADPDSDLAVLRVEVPADRLYPLALGNSDILQVGQSVLALGNPYANDWTLTAGIVSALNRSITGENRYSIGGVIQTDAAINPGNSGGPLLNLQGEVVGVNTKILRNTDGIGFAIPSNLVQRVTQDLIAAGQVQYAFMGISSRTIDLDLIEEFRLPNNLRGVAVLEARAGLPAAEAGLRTIGIDSIDVITAIDGKPISDYDELIGYLAINTTPGQQVTLTVYRNGATLQLPVLLTARP